MGFKRMVIGPFVAALVLALACSPAHAQTGPSERQYPCEDQKGGCPPDRELDDAPKDAFRDATIAQESVTDGFSEDRPPESRPAFADEPAGDEGQSAPPATGTGAEGHWPGDGSGRAAPAAPAASGGGGTHSDDGASSGAVAEVSAGASGNHEDEEAEGAPDKAARTEGVGGNLRSEAEGALVAQKDAADRGSITLSASSAGQMEGPMEVGGARQVGAAQGEGYDGAALPETGGARPGHVALAAALSVAGAYRLARRLLSMAGG